MYHKNLEVEGGMFFIFTSLPKDVGISYIGNPKVISSFSSTLLDPLSSSSLTFLSASYLILSPSSLTLSIYSLASLSNISLSSPLLFGSISSSQNIENSLVHSGNYIPSLID
jgi:hypothetical protein